MKAKSESELLSDLFLKDLCFNMRRTSKPLTNLYNKILKQMGYSLECTQCYLLFVLYSVFPEGLRFTELSEKLLTDRTTVNRVIMPLAERKFVVIDRKGKDRRVSYCKLTDSGRKLIQEMIPLFRRIDFFIKNAVGAIGEINSDDLSIKIRQFGDLAFGIKLEGGECDE